MAKQKHAATFLGTQLGLSFVEDRVYGYSGSIAVDATQKDLLNFTTGAKALSCKVQFNYVQVTSESYTYRIYFNDTLIQAYTVRHAEEETSPDNLLLIIIPPLTRVRLTAQNGDDNNARRQIVSITGKVL